MIARASIWLAGILVAAGILCGCAPTTAYITACKIEGAAAESVMDSYQAWRQFDKAHQDALVNAAPDKASAQKAVGDWRSKVQSQVDKAFADAVDALKTFSNALEATDAVKAKDFSTAISDLVAAVMNVVSVLQRYGISIKLPGVPL